MKHELYESPIVEVMEVEIEQGFATSIDSGNPNSFDKTLGNNDWLNE